MRFIRKQWIKALIVVGLIVLSFILWIVDGYKSFLTTIIAGLVVGLISSFSITLLFENEKKKNKADIRKLTIENFIYASADYIFSLEIWCKKHFRKDIKLFSSPEILLDLLDNLRNTHKDIEANKIDKKYSMLVNDYVYSIAPVYYSFKQLNSQQLLLNEIISIDEYNFFHNTILNDMLDEFLETKKKDRFGELVSGYYIFHQLRVCLNCVINARKIYPEIEEKYLEISKQ